MEVSIGMLQNTRKCKPKTDYDRKSRPGDRGISIALLIRSLDPTKGRCAMCILRGMVHEYHFDLISAVRDCLEKRLFAMDSHRIV